MFFAFKRDITLIYNNGSDIETDLNMYNKHSEIINLLEIRNIFKSSFSNYKIIYDAIKYFIIYHDENIFKKNHIQLKKSFDFNDKYYEPKILCGDSRMEIYKYLNIYEIKNMSLVSKDFLSELRQNKTILFLKNQGGLNFFNKTFEKQTKEYKLWWIYSTNSYFNIIRKRWEEYILDENDEYNEKYLTQIESIYEYDLELF
jgi:hypothetical protein